MKLAGLELKNHIMTASGICSYPDMLKRMEIAGVAAVVPKTIGIEAREGYRNPTVVEPYHGVILNCMGRPGPGYKAFRSEMEEYSFNVPVIVSIDGKDENEFAFLIRELDSVADAYELNVSCPNVDIGGYHIGYEPVLLEKVLRESRKVTEKPLSVKLPYYSGDDRKLERVIRVIENSGMDWITEINTLRSMSYSVEMGRPVLSNIVGGQSGPSIHGCALAQVYNTMKLTDLPIVGVGGIVKSDDAKDFLSVGACAVQLGSGLMYYDTPEDFVAAVLSGL